MPGDKVQVQSADQAIASILSTLGGTKTTTSAGDTGILQGAVQQLQGADYQALLQSIFQQAGTQIPGMQTALGNAVGARRGSNTAIQMALQKLMADTTLAGQQQLVQQQQSNLNSQIQAGQGVAQATKGTTQQSGTNLSRAAGVVGLLTGLTKLTGSATVQDMFKKAGWGDSGTAATQAVSTTPATATVARPVAAATQPAVVPATSAPVISLAAPAVNTVLPVAAQEPSWAGMSDLLAAAANDQATLQGIDPMDALMSQSGAFGTELPVDNYDYTQYWN